MHFLQQFHPKFNPDAEKLAAAEGYDNWIKHFDDRLNFDPRRKYIQPETNRVLPRPITFESLKTVAWRYPKVIQVCRIVQHHQLQLRLALDSMRPLGDAKWGRTQPLRSAAVNFRINDQWRVCFVWSEGGAWKVELADYH